MNWELGLEGRILALQTAISKLVRFFRVVVEMEQQVFGAGEFDSGRRGNIYKNLGKEVNRQPPYARCNHERKPPPLESERHRAR